MNRLIVRYEQICNSPETVLSAIGKVCGLLNVKAPETVFSNEMHSIGGSPSKITRKGDAIQLDTRWMSDFLLKDIEQFNKTSGWLNTLLGYDYSPKFEDDDGNSRPSIIGTGIYRSHDHQLW